jgi:hypothetical protein
MKCELCGDQTRVARTRVPEKDTGADLSRARDLVSWYVPDGFTSRKRTCPCGHRFATIEVVTDDLSEMLEIVSNKGLAAARSPE